MPAAPVLPCRYDAHWDWFDDPVHHAAYLHEGNRYATVLMYLAGACGEWAGLPTWNPTCRPATGRCTADWSYVFALFACRAGVHSRCRVALRVRLYDLRCASSLQSSDTCAQPRPCCTLHALTACNARGEPNLALLHRATRHTYAVAVPACEVCAHAVHARVVHARADGVEGGETNLPLADPIDEELQAIENPSPCAARMGISVRPRKVRGGGGGAVGVAA